MSESLAIDFKGVCKSYSRKNGDSVEALTDFNLQVPSGQVFGFAGPNGAGKSTAIKILVGLLRPSQGEARIFGSLAGSRIAKAQIGFLPEVTLYHEFMRAQELLAIHATLAGVSAKENPGRCEEALAKVGLGDRKQSYLKEFSKGMKQRFGIAQALVGSPKVLVLDELTSGLDPNAQISLLELLLELRDQGITIFFSSHHLREIEKICDSVAILHQGKLRCSGTISEVLGESDELLIKARFDETSSLLDEDNNWEKSSTGYQARVSVSDAPKLLAKVNEAEAEIVSLDSARMSLETLFHELTAEPVEKVPS